MPRRSSRRIASPRLRNRLRCEALEDRRVLATYVVSSTADAGAGSLREAIDLANATATIADEIVFDETVFATPQAILLDSQLPTITDALAIVGPGAELLALDGQNGNSRVPFTGDGWQALQVTDSSSSTRIEVAISGLTFTNFDKSVALSNAESLVLDSVVFLNTHGRAVTNTGVLVVRDAFFENNRGGAIANDDDLKVFNSRFVGNQAYEGGAIFNSGDATITDSQFEANVSTRYGGAICSPDAGDQITIMGSTFVANEASILGGAAYLGNEVDASIIINSTFSGHKAGAGAAIAVRLGLTLRHSTVFDNRVTTSDRAAIEALYTDTVLKIDHSIVAGTLYQSSPAADLRASTQIVITDSVIGYDNQGLVDGENGNYVGSQLTPLDPHLAPLAMNGGPTPTHAPLPGSVAINAGDPDYTELPGATDQRGGPYQRVVGGRIDIGAVEAQGPVTAAPGDFNGDGRFDAADYTVWRDSLGLSVAPLSTGDATGDGLVDETDRLLWVSRYGDRYVAKVEVNDLADDDDGDIYNGRTTLREAINYTNENAWADRITFDPALSGGVIEVGTTNSGRYYQIESELTIDASILPEGITLDAGERTTGLHINAFHVNTNNDFDVTLIGLTIENGVGQFGGGGAVNSLMTGTLMLIDCQLFDNLSGRRYDGQIIGQGGAIFARGPVHLTDTTIDGATSGTLSTATGGSGSAIYAVGDVTLVRSHLRNVEALPVGGGGAIVAAGFDPQWPYVRLDVAPSVQLIDSSIIGAVGGGIVAPGTVTLIGSTLEGLSGVGIVASGNGSLPLVGNVELVDSTVRGFSVTETGGTYGYLGTPGGVGIAAMGSVSLVRSHVEDNTVVNPTSTKGGGIYARGTASLLDSVVDGNSAAYGAGIYAEGRTVGGANHPTGTPVVSIVGSSVSGNTALRNGGAITSRGAVFVEASSISDNAIASSWTDSLRQAIVSIDSPVSPSSQPVVSFTDVVLADNSGPLDPVTGRITPSYVLAGYSYPVNATFLRTHVIDNQLNGVSARSIYDSVISRNAGFGAIVQEEIRGTTVSGNQGGGLATADDHLLISDSVIRGNSTVFDPTLQSTVLGLHFAAGIQGTPSRIVLERSTVTGNHLIFSPTWGASSYPLAGGISASELVAIDSTISDNLVEGPGVKGGGVNLGRTNYARFYRSTVSGNRAVGDNARGGGVYSVGFVELVQSTVSGNSVEGANTLGGGVYARDLSATHSTITANAADSVGGGAYLTSASGRLHGTILAGNVAPAGSPDLQRVLDTGISVVYSLIGDTTGSGIDAATGVGNLLNVDPLLGPLQDNGGPTWTHALLAGSPAIDAGDPTRTAVPWSILGFSSTGEDDQRGDGFPRVLDGGSGGLRIDIGAFEAASPISPAFLIDSTPKDGSAYSSSYAETIDRALAEVGDWRTRLAINIDIEGYRLCKVQVVLDKRAVPEMRYVDDSEEAVEAAVACVFEEGVVVDV
ncbi:choice-of-anchor Q domain-containing protein [Botrimarina mediterranea]|uniref:choice-of-anchor Q domain-containing protein n=1 Tax=Botrimarina mediterranea TaxID=2528022 RepID=UPI0011A4EF11